MGANNAFLYSQPLMLFLMQKKSWFQSCFRVYRELFNISLPISFNLEQKCTQELMKDLLLVLNNCVYDISKNIILWQRCLLLRRVCNILNAVLHFASYVRVLHFVCNSWICV